MVDIGSNVFYSLPQSPRAGGTHVIQTSNRKVIGLTPVGELRLPFLSMPASQTEKFIYHKS